MLCEDEARALLASFVMLDQTWGAHSVTVATVAGRIATALRDAGADADPALARTGGLLHDIGRSVTHDISGHSWEGSEFLLARGQPELARFCTAHQFAGMLPAEALVIGWPAADYRPRSWEEKAVTIADGLVAGSRVVLLAERCADARARYRPQIPDDQYALLAAVEPKMRALMGEVEAVTGQSIEALCDAQPLRG